MGKIIGAGQAWIVPIGSSDFVQVDKDVLSFEHGGALNLVRPIGHLTADGLAPALEPYLNVVRRAVEHTADVSGVPLHLLMPDLPAED